MFLRLVIFQFQKRDFNIFYDPLHSTISSAAAAPLYRVEHTPRPVLEQIGDVTDGVSVGQEIPAPSPVAVVVEPRSEDQIGGGPQKDAENG